MCSADTQNDKPFRFTHIIPTLSTGQYITLAILTILFWLLTHPYYGIWHDAILYTAQALKILYPEIYQEDIFFKYGSQANFTLFPELHALLIEQMGVDNSAFLLTIIGQLFLFVGSISFARLFLTPGQSILFIIFFTTFPVYSNPVLYIFEIFATSRSISSGLSLIFLTLLLKKRIIAASIALFSALLIHPLMPLGAIMIALFLQRPKVVISLISFGLLFFIFGYAFSIPPISHLSLTIDSGWRNLVVQRAPFLFIEYWPKSDLHLLLFDTCIILSARAYCTDKLKQVFNALLMATALCLIITLAASWLSNVLLIQLQTWRILLLVHIFSAIALAWLVSAAWNKNCGKLVILLYFSIFLSLNTIGWLPAMAVHLFWAWSLKHNPTLPPLLLKGAYLILGQQLFWFILRSDFVDEFGTIGADFSLIHNIKYGLGGNPFYVTALLIALLLYSKRAQKTYSIYLSITILFLAPIAIASFDQRYKNETWDEGNTEPYITLRKEIPENATVYCEQGIQTCWLTLRRRHYMSLYQSAGIVFARETAYETKRRSDLLFNAGYEDGIFPKHWHISTKIELPEPTPYAFNELCQDPVLDYIVTRSTSTPKKPDKVINTDGKQLNIYYCSQMSIEHQAL